MTDHDASITTFCALTNANHDVALHYLMSADWNLEAAVQQFFARDEEQGSDEDEPAVSSSSAGNAAAAPTPAPVPGGGRTLGGDGAPSVSVPSSSEVPSSASGGASSQQQKKKFGSLRDLAGGAPAGAEDDDEDDADYDPDLYAGGEKSGLAVQNPDDLKRKILEKAKRQQQQQQQGRAADEPAQQTRQSHFTGRAQTLGGDDAPSRVLEDPNAGSSGRQQPPPRVERTLHFWADGFSVDDGPLYRNDDPENAERLEMIRRGRAPYDILNVSYDQEADVKLEQHEGPFVQPKKSFRPFSGQGQRLGSPTPGLSGAVEPPPPARQPAATSTRAPAAAVPKMEIDDSQPAISIQIRLGDGTRLASRFNTSHTVGDVYGFVSASNPASQERAWALMTTFPSQELTDKSKVLGDMADFKRGGTVVQKWK